MSRIFIVVTACVVLFAARAFPQSNLTGPDWNGWSKEQRAIYLLGWVDGRQSGAYEAVKEFRPDLSKHWNDSKSPVKKLFGTVTVGQIMAGLNKFYEDYRNFHIEVRSAVALIWGDATGRRPLTEDMLIQIRKISAEEKGHP